MGYVKHQLSELHYIIRAKIRVPLFQICLFMNTFLCLLNDTGGEEMLTSI